MTQFEDQRLSWNIQAGLEAIIRGIVADPSVIFSKGVKSLERIREMHDPDTYAQKLREIYQKALKD